MTTLRRLTDDEAARLRRMSCDGVTISQMALEFGRSTGWISMQRRDALAEIPRKRLSIPRNARMDTVLSQMSHADREVIRKAAEARGTTISGLAAALLATIAREPTLIDAVLDDGE